MAGHASQSLVFGKYGLKEFEELIVPTIHVHDQAILHSLRVLEFFLTDQSSSSMFDVCLE